MRNDIKDTKNVKLEILFNWAANNPVKPTNKYRKILGLEDKVIFLYGGSIGYQQDVMNIIRLATRMQDIKEAHFLIVGAGDEVDLIKNAIKERDLKNVTFLDAMPQQDFKELLAECDVGLFTLNKNLTTHNFPGKLLGYMVQSIPILGSINPNNDLKEVIEEANAGLVTINGEDEKFYQNALKMLNKRYREYYGANAKRLLDEKFSIKSAAKKILQSA